jgi:hypothetical protein
MNVSVSPTNGRPALFAFVTKMVTDPGLSPTGAVNADRNPFSWNVTLPLP